MLQQTKEVIKTISTDAFWNAQVGQIDITQGKTFELIPVVGSHVIRLGTGYGAEGKLRKLLVFYQNVLPKAGLAKYSVLDVQFEGQVVAVKRGLVSKVDSLQLQKNIEELMEKKLAEQEPVDEVPATIPVNRISNGDFEVEPTSNDTVYAKPVVTEKSTAPETKLAAKPVAQETEKPTEPKVSQKKTTVQVGRPVAKKKETEKKPDAPKPKAVMQPQVENEY